MFGLSACAFCQHVSCKIDSSERSTTELAYDRHDIKSFPKLIHDELAKQPTNPRYRLLDIGFLLSSGKLDEAAGKVQTWTTDAPGNAYAVLAAAKYRHALGDWPEAYALAVRSVKLDPCLAEAYVEMALFEEAAGYRLTAAKNLALARQLAPNDQSLRRSWIDSLPNAQKQEQMAKFVQDSKMLNDAQRRQAERNLAHSEAIEANRCQLDSVQGEARIPMIPIDTGYERRWGLQVFFNGRPRNLILDTGASGFLLSNSARGTLHLTPIVSARVGGFGNDGSTASDLLSAASVKIGGLEFSHCLVEALSSFGAMGGSSMGMGQLLDTYEGLIGSDVFSRYLMTLDYIQHEVRLAPLPASPTARTSEAGHDPLGGSTSPDWMRVDRYTSPEMASWARIYREGHLLVVPATVSSETKKVMPALFIADTGSIANLVDGHAIAEFTKVKEGITVMQGLSGKGLLNETGAFNVDFAGIRLPVKAMDSLDMQGAGGPIGFLGQPTLEQLVIHLDYRDNLALFEAPNAHKR